MAFAPKKKKDDGPKTATTAQGGIVHYANGRKVEKAKTIGPANDETGKPNPRWGGAGESPEATVAPTEHAKATGSAAPPPDNTPPKAKTPEEAHAAMDSEASATESSTKAVTPPKQGTAGKVPPGAKPSAPPAKKKKPPFGR